VRDRGKQIDEVSVGIAEQQCAIAPRHCGGRGHNLVQPPAKTFVFGVHVSDEELDDGTSIARGLGRPEPEQWDGLIATDGQSTNRCRDLSEEFIAPRLR
jgi:hypothetical protein